MNNENKILIIKTKKRITAKIYFPKYKKELCIFAQYKTNAKKICDFYCLLLCLPIIVAFSFEDNKYRFINACLSNDEKQKIKKLLKYGKYISKFLYSNPSTVQLITQSRKAERKKREKKRSIGLFFGGGAESLLSLAHLLKKYSCKDITLQSLVGPGWIGSDPHSNKYKNILDAKISQDLNVKLSTIQTNLWKIISDCQNIFKKHLKHDVHVANSGVFNLILYTTCVPHLTRTGVYKVYHGLEKENNFDNKLFCMSLAATKMLKRNSLAEIQYQTLFLNHTKIQIFNELATRYKSMLKYQYSCFSNKNKRWCESCEKCFRYLLLCYCCDVDPALIGLHQKSLLLSFFNPFSSLVCSLSSGEYQKAIYSEIERFALKQKRFFALSVLSITKTALSLNKLMRWIKWSIL